MLNNEEDEPFEKIDNKNKLPEGVFISIIISIVVIIVSILFMILIISLQDMQKASVTYTAYFPLSVTETYKETIEENEPKTYIYYIDTLNPEVTLICGEDIPIGDYDLKIISIDRYNSVYLNDKDDFKYEGFMLESDQAISCMENQRLMYEGTYGSIKLIAKMK